MYIVWCVYTLYILKDGFEKNYWLLMKNNHENIEPFNSHEWSRENVSLQCQCNIKQTSDESKEE